MEAPVGAFGRALAGEHAGRILAGAPVRIHAAGVGIVAGQMLAHQETQQLAPVAITRRCDLRDLLVTQGFAVVLHAHGLAAHEVLVDLAGDRVALRGPVAQQADRLAGECLHRLVVALTQQRHRALRRPVRHLQRGMLVHLERFRQQRIAQLAQRLVIMLGTAGRVGHLLDAGIDRAALLGDLGEIADALPGNQHGRPRFLDRHVDLGLEIAARRAR